VPTWGGGDDRWDRAYAHFGLPYPTERVRLLRGRKKQFVPYFNAGFVAFPDRPEAEGQPRFADRWVETALDLDHNCRIGGKRPWLDQISLPLTLARFGYDNRGAGGDVELFPRAAQGLCADAGCPRLPLSPLPLSRAGPPVGQHPRRFLGAPALAPSRRGAGDPVATDLLDAD
jgi:hypothetical protein